MQSDDLNRTQQGNKFRDTFTSSSNEHKDNNFLFEKSLVKGIKQNDISKIIDVGEDGGNVDIKEIFNEEKEVKAIFVEMRKKYDDIKATVNRKENEIAKFQKSLQELKFEQQKFLDQQSNTKKSLSHLSDKLKYLQEIVEFSTLDKDIYLQMQDRLKKDIIFYKKHSFTCDKSLNRDRVRLKSLQKNAQVKSRLSYRCKTILGSMQKTVGDKQRERGSKIHSFCQVLNRKQESAIKQQMRQKEIQQVMMSAMTDKLQQEKEWEKILCVNLFLKKLLKNKMQAAIAQNSEIQTVFHKIKQATNVADSADFINKFINREKNYGTLLESISEKENQLLEEKQRKEQLEKEFAKLQQAQSQIEDESKKRGVIPAHSQQEIETYNAHVLQIQGQKEMMYRWGIKFEVVYNHGNRHVHGEDEELEEADQLQSSRGKTRDQAMQQYPRQKLQELICDCLNKMSAFVDEFQLKLKQTEEKQQKQRQQQQQQLVVEKQNVHIVYSELLQIEKNVMSQINQANHCKTSTSFANEVDMAVNPRKRVFSGRHQEKNIRIRTLSTWEDDLKTGGQSGGSPMAGMTSMGTEDQQQYDDQSQIEYLHFNRKATKKSDLSRRFRVKTKPN